jgi:glutathione S-transferase/GST-like protein
MTVELYFFQPLVTNSARVFLALLEKGVPFEERLLTAGAHLQEPYLKINPKGQVPALVHDGRALSEGMCINEYIDETFEGPELRPADPRERWRMRTWSRYADTDLGRALMMINWNRIMPRMQSQRTKEQMEQFAKSVPDPDRRRAWLNAATQQTPPEQIEESHRRVRAGVRRIEEALKSRPYIAGKTYSLADIDLLNFYGYQSMWLPDWIKELNNDKDTPATMDWLGRLSERPAIKEMHARTVRPSPPPQAAA